MYIATSITDEYVLLKG